MARQPTPEERPADVRRTQELGMSYKPIAPAPSSTPGSSTPGPGTPVPTGEDATPSLLASLGGRGLGKKTACRLHSLSLSLLACEVGVVT